MEISNIFSKEKSVFWGVVSGLLVLAGLQAMDGFYEEVEEKDSMEEIALKASLAMGGYFLGGMASVERERSKKKLSEIEARVSEIDNLKLGNE